MAEEKPKLKLSGFDGNAFAILGKAKQASQKAGWSKEKFEVFMEECKSGDYDHLLQTCMKYFDVT